VVIRTLGHGTLAVSEFLDVARGAELEVIVDVRRFPGSRRNPQFGSDEMARWLGDHGLGYEWLESLGGRRKAALDSPNQGLRNDQFRAYADYMMSSEFARGVEQLCGLAQTGMVAVMCAESVWWRCHRRLLADHLVLIEDTRVEHVFHDGRVAPHLSTPEAHRVNDHLVYAASPSQPDASMPASRKQK
jgi:uncharacterized protein (DUF488 family)